MATLTPEKFCPVADGGWVQVDVDPTPHGDAVLFERVVPFDTVATPTSPPFQQVPLVFTEGGPYRYQTRAPVGSLYQARLYARDAVPDGASPTDRDRPIGWVDLPCVYVEAREPDLLTNCAGVPQLTLDVGDTWLGAVLVTGSLPTRMLLQVGAEAPAEEWVATGKWPRFGERVPSASAASAGPARVHRVYAPPRTPLPVEDGIDPRSTVHYVAVVWLEDGRWDHVWSAEGAAPASAPQPVTTRTRDVEVKVTSITCMDDSFESSFGVAWHDPSGRPIHDPDGDAWDPVEDDSTFELVLGLPDGTALARRTFRWEDMDGGDVVRPPHLEIGWSGGAEGRGARVFLGAGGGDAYVEVPLPVGEGTRSSTHLVRATGTAGSDDELAFYADLTVTVGYS